VKVANIESLINQVTAVRNQWPAILEEAKLAAQTAKIHPELPVKRKVKRIHLMGERVEGDDGCPTLGDNESQEEASFRTNVFYRIVDSVIGGLTVRFTAVKEICNKFSFLWEYQKLSESEIRAAASNFSEIYSNDVSETELIEELLHLKQIHNANFGQQQLPPFQLLQKIAELKLNSLFCNVIIALRIFCTIPVPVASAERSFSKLKLVKNYLRSTMGQERTSDLALISIECVLARKMDFSDVIDAFAKKKARKVALF
jgi:hypothetical protein